MVNIGRGGELGICSRYQASELFLIPTPGFAGTSGPKR